MAFATPTQLATVSSNSSGQTSLTSGSVVFPTNGQAVMGFFTCGISGTATAETITASDNLGNTWNVYRIDDNTGSAGGHTAIGFFKYASAGSDTTATVTVSWGTAVNERFAWFGYTTGHDTSSPEDVKGGATATGSGTTLTATTSTPNSGNRGANDELGIYAFTHGTTSVSGTPPSSWSLLMTNPSDGTRARCGSFGYIITSGGSGSTLSAGAITFTANSLTPAVMSISTFKPAAAAGGSATSSTLSLLGVG